MGIPLREGIGTRLMGLNQSIGKMGLAVIPGRAPWLFAAKALVYWGRYPLLRSGFHRCQAKEDRIGYASIPVPWAIRRLVYMRRKGAGSVEVSQ